MNQDARPDQPDVVEQSVWRPLFRLTRAMDDEIAALYAEIDAAAPGLGLGELKPTQSQVLLRLASRGPMTISQLAQSLDITHSAASQKVTALRSAGFVESQVGSGDARTRSIRLTERAERLVAMLRAEWLATVAALAEIEAEIPYPVSRAVRDVHQALQRKSFRDRIKDHLAAELNARPWE